MALSVSGSAPSHAVVARRSITHRVMRALVAVG
jgi:hypothetical protein